MNSSTPSHETIAEQAYHLWEQEGRPDGRADEFWLRAEQTLRAGAPADAAPDHPPAPRESDPPPESDPLNLQSGPEISNLDRALSPQDRRSARAAERTEPPDAVRTADARAQPHHYIILVDRAHLRIYGADDSAGVPIATTALDAPAGRASYVADQSDQAGRFPGVKKPRARGEAAAAVGSIDERLPMQEERDRRLVQEWADRISTFLQEHPNSTWDFAAGPAMHNALLERVSTFARQRLRFAVQKDLVNQPPSELREHFPVSPS